MYTRTVGALLTHCPRRQGSHACMNRKRAAQHSCTCMHLKACACVQTQVRGGGGTIARSLAPCVAVSIFDSESIIFNLSEGICVMKADANSNTREKKQHNSSEKAKANPCSDAIIHTTKSGLTWIDTEHKIILREIRCGWHYIAPNLPFPTPLTPFLLFSPSFFLWLSSSISPCPSSVIIIIASWFFIASDLKNS